MVLKEEGDMLIRVLSVRASRLCVLILCAVLAACANDKDKALDYFDKAQSLYNEGDLHRASVQLKNALKKDETLADAYFMQAKIFRAWREWKPMYAFLLKTLEHNPRHLEANIMLAQVYVEAGKHDRAKEPMAVLADLAPETSEYWVLQGAMHLHSAEYRQALDYAERSLQREANSRDAVLLKVHALAQQEDIPGAVKFLRNKVAQVQDRAALLLELARLEMGQGNTEGAIDAWHQLIQYQPEKVIYRFRLAAMLVENDLPEQAEQVLRQAVRDNPDNIDAKLGLANYLGRMDYRQAIEVLLAYMPNDDVDPELKIALGEYYEKGGEPEQASAVYLSLFTTDEDLGVAADAGARLASIALRQDRQREALGLITEVLAKDHVNVDALTMRAVIHLWQRDTDAAITDLQTVLREQPDTEVALLLLAKAQLQSSNQILAINALEKLLALNPDNETAVLLMAQTLSHDGQRSAARDLLQQYLQRHPGQLIAMEALVEQHLWLGEWKSAQAMAKQAVQAGASSTMLPLVDAEIARRNKRFADSDALYFSLLRERAAEREATLGLFANARMQDQYEPTFKRLQQSLSTTASPTVGELLAREYMALGKLDAAQELIAQHEDDWPQAKALSAELAVLRGDLEYAAQQAEAYVAEHNTDVRMQLLLASIYQRQEQAERAIAVYREVLSYTPSNDLAANNLASLLAQQDGSLSEALRWARRFEYTANPYYRDTLAMLYLKQGEFHRAAVLMRKVVDEHGDNALFHQHLGQILLALSDKTGARHHFEQALAALGDGSDEAAQREELSRQLRQLDAASS